MRYAGFSPDGEPADVQAEEPFHRLMGELGGLTNEQLIVLIDQAWEEYREPGRLQSAGPPSVPRQERRQVTVIPPTLASCFKYPCEG